MVCNDTAYLGNRWVILETKLVVMEAVIVVFVKMTLLIIWFSYSSQLRFICYNNKDYQYSAYDEKYVWPTLPSPAIWKRASVEKITSFRDSFLNL